MAEEITSLESPIDVMYLMHAAFRKHSERTEKLASELEHGGELQPFKEAFDYWVKQLLYHATTEDKYMTAPLTGQAARDNETEHAELVTQATGVIEAIEKGDSAGLADNIKAAIIQADEKQHEELVEKAQEVEAALKAEIGADRMAARSRRHLYRGLMEMRVLEYDHFENEEAFILPMIKQDISDAQELEIARRLLFDDDADDPRWIIDWVASELSPNEQKLLSDLEAQFGAVRA